MTPVKGMIRCDARTIDVCFSRCMSGCDTCKFVCHPVDMNSDSEVMTAQKSTARRGHHYLPLM